MTPAELQHLARRQLTDYDAHSPGTIFAEPSQPQTIEDAYRLQIETARLRRARGEAIAGYKIGCVSQTIRRQLGIDHAVFGHLFESEIRRSGDVLPVGNFDHLGIEGEFALTLAEDVPDPEALRGAPHRYVQQVFPVIELHNFVFRAAKPSAVELIANNAAHAGIVVPDARAVVTGGEELEIAVSINGERQGVSRPDPLAILHELAELLSAFDLGLHEGQIVLTGSPMPLYRVNAGDCIEVRSRGIADVVAVVGT